ncbi:glycosyltransferase family 4 protein [Patescibacteria group bacterium]|nr:glycosyltransferase family 4 protein [Patescibacteria group bacterium]
MGTVAADYALALMERGQEVTVFTPAYGRGLGGKEVPRVERLQGIFHWGNAAFIPGLFFKLKEQDVIHLHYPFYGGAIFACLAAFIWRIPLIVSYHMKTKSSGLLGMTFFIYQQLIEPLILRRAEVVLVSTLDYARSIGLKHRNLVEMPFGVDTQWFHPGSAPEMRTFFGIDHESIMFLFVGGLDDAHYFKGVDVLLQACAKLSQDSDWHVVIAGGGNRLATYQAKTLELGLGERVHFSDQVSVEELPKLYRESDVHILPSIDRSEAFGIVTIEAGASGLPSIVTDLPGVRTLVEKRETGLVIAPAVPNALAVAMEWMIQHPEKIDAFGRNGRERVLLHYDKERLVDRLQHLYRTRKV